MARAMCAIKINDVASDFALRLQGVLLGLRGGEDGDLVGVVAEAGTRIAK